MTGGGFGGCIIAMVAAGQSNRIGHEVAQAFARAGFREPVWFDATPAPGASRLI